MSKSFSNWGFGALLLCLSSIAFATPAAAAPNHWAWCVQESLELAGFDPNGVDGAIGGGTRKAATAWADANGVTLPALSNETAPEWCAALNDGDPLVTIEVSITSSGEMPASDAPAGFLPFKIGKEADAIIVPYFGTNVGFSGGEYIEDELGEFYSSDVGLVTHISVPRSVLDETSMLCVGARLPSSDWSYTFGANGEGSESSVTPVYLCHYVYENGNSFFDKPIPGLSSGFVDGVVRIELAITAK